MEQSMTRNMIRTAVFVTVSIAAPLCAAAESDLRVSLGAEYTTGNYGTGADTSIWYFPLSLSYGSEVTTFSVTVPYLIVEGPGNVTPAIGDTPRGMAPGMGAMQVVRPGAVAPTRRRESGLGDVVLSGSVRLVAEAPAQPRIDLTGKIKLATADEDKNLGTGENDYAVQLDLEKGIFFGYLGYRVYGDPPGINLDNVAYGFAGLSRPLDSATRAGVSLYAQQAAAAGTDNQLELSLFLNRKLGKGNQLRPYVIFGLSDGSPDWGVGVTLALYR
jgi:hypothetical protein